MQQQNNVRLVLCDRNISVNAVSALNSIGIETVFTVPLSGVDNSTSTHPDIQFVKVHENAAYVAKENFEYYRQLLPEYTLTPMPGIHSPYPYDTALNYAYIGDKIIMTHYQHDLCNEKKNEKTIYVRQGYVKCNVCVLNDKAFITSDAGIAKAGQNAGLRVYVLPPYEIELAGYPYGFWGGCSGIIGKNKVFFNGNIERLECSDKLFNILQNEKIEPVYCKADKLCDNGSIIALN